MEGIEQRMIAEGFKPPRIIEDGKIHRFPTSNKSRCTAGWYAATSDGFWIFGDWRTGLRVVSRDGNGKMDRATFRAPRQKRVEPDRKAAALKARNGWAVAKPASPDHPYLVRKRVIAYGLRQYVGNLLIPMSAGRRICSLQFIFPDGSKRYMKGGQVKGCSFVIPGKEKVALCEGYATGATIHEATGWKVIVCFDAANLVRVARTLPKGGDYIVCADNDHATKGNPGLTAGRKAAKILGACLVLPSGKGTDFNDMSAELGLAAVKAYLRGW